MTKKELILSTAEELFSEKGYEKTTMDDIAKCLGIRKGGIYYHFKNKEDIMRNVVIKQIDFYIEHIKSHVENSESAEEKLRAYAIGRLVFLNEFKQSYEYLKNDFVESCQFVKSNKKDLETWEVEFVRSIFANDTDDESIETACRVLTDIVITFSRGIELSLFLGEAESRLQERSEIFIELVIAKYKQVINSN